MYRPKQIDEHLSVVETPATEFMLEIISVKKGETAKIPTLSVPRILIGFKGVGSIHTASDMEVKYLREGEIRNRRGSILFRAPMLTPLSLPRKMLLFMRLMSV